MEFIDCKRAVYKQFDALANNADRLYLTNANKMKAPYSDNQLSGLGFSSTIRNSVICKVTGSFTRTIKVNF